MAILDRKEFEIDKSKNNPHGRLLSADNDLIEAIEVLTEALECCKRDHRLDQVSKRALDLVWGSEKGDGDEN